MTPPADLASTAAALCSGAFQVGLDYGPTRSELGHVTGRMTYRGKPMNRAARIGSGASSGQVLCSSDAWAAATASAGLPRDATMVAGVTATRLGSYMLKGVMRVMLPLPPPFAPPPFCCSYSAPLRHFVVRCASCSQCLHNPSTRTAGPLSARHLLVARTTH
jgi:hypothetical protein